MSITYNTLKISNRNWSPELTYWSLNDGSHTRVPSNDKEINNHNYQNHQEQEYPWQSSAYRSLLSRGFNINPLTFTTNDNLIIQNQLSAVRLGNKFPWFWSKNVFETFLQFLLYIQNNGWETRKWTLVQQNMQVIDTHQCDCTTWFPELSRLM